MSNISLNYCGVTSASKYCVVDWRIVAGAVLSSCCCRCWLAICCVTTTRHSTPGTSHQTYDWRVKRPCSSIANAHKLLSLLHYRHKRTSLSHEEWRSAHARNSKHVDAIVETVTVWTVDSCDQLRSILCQQQQQQRGTNVDSLMLSSCRLWTSNTMLYCMLDCLTGQFDAFAAV